MLAAKQSASVVKQKAELTILKSITADSTVTFLDRVYLSL
jgi:hypothetical protein